MIRPGQAGWGLWAQWMLTSAMGIAIGSAVGGQILAVLVGAITISGVSMAVSALGAVLGTMQWLTLQGQSSRSHLWGLLAIGGWALGGFVLAASVGISSPIARGASTASVVLVGVLGGVLIGALIAAGQWLALGKNVPWARSRVLATMAGWGVGGLVLVGVFVGSTVAAVVGFGAMVGVWVGTSQWLVVRRRVSRAAWWVLASVAGWALASLVLIPVAHDAPRETGDVTGFVILYGTVVGLLLGIVQWPMLSGRSRRPVWWVLASGGGWAIGSLILAGAVATRGELTGGTLVLAVGAMGAVAGAVTGVPLVWYLRQPVSMSSD